ncbi:hypothetical protein HHI36_010954, partial [Cryptolaemus montrouzieri]
MVAQKHFIRLMGTVGRRHESKPLFNKLSLLTIHELFRMQATKAIYMYRIHLRCLLFTNKRGKLNFKLPVVKHTLLLQSFNYLAPKMFNSLKIHGVLSQKQ